MEQSGRKTGRNVLTGLVLACVLGALVSGVAVVSGDSQPEGALFQTDIDADSILMEATIDEEGDGDWRVVYRLQLDDNESVAAFEELRTEIQSDPASYRDPFEDRIGETVGSARASTGREMTATNFTVGTERESQPDAEFGLVTFRFEWNGFATVEDGGDTIRAGDAVERLFLDDGTSLRFRWPAAYQLQSHTPVAASVEDQRLTWRGQLEFDSGEPQAVLTTGDAADGETPTQGPTDDSGLPLGWLAVAAAALLVGAGGWLFVRTRDQQSVEEPSDEPETDEGPPPELMSNEERVLQLLEQHGGRMKQKELAEQLDWTAAKTSQVVGDLREEDTVEAFRLGRENVLTLPDVDIEGETDDDSMAGEE